MVRDQCVMLLSTGMGIILQKIYNSAAVDCRRAADIVLTIVKAVKRIDSMVVTVADGLRILLSIDPGHLLSVFQITVYNKA